MYILVLIILLWAAVHILVNIWNARKIEQEQPMVYNQWSDLYPQLKTGDIILFRKNIRKGIHRAAYFFQTTLTGSYFGHAGVIIVRDGVPYVIECTNYTHSGYKVAMQLNNKRQGGVRIIKLDTLLPEYDAKCIAIKSIEQAIPNKVVEEKLIGYRDKIFESLVHLFFPVLFDFYFSHTLARKFTKGSENQLFCTEFVYKLLHDCGVVKEYPAKLFWPARLTDGTFDHLTRVKYSKPYLVSVEKTKP